MTDDKITTKKMLVAFDPKRGDKASSDFLAPLNDSTGVSLFGLRSKKLSEHGMVVYIGKEALPVFA